MLGRAEMHIALVGMTANTKVLEKVGSIIPDQVGLEGFFPEVEVGWLYLLMM